MVHNVSLVSQYWWLNLEPHTCQASVPAHCLIFHFKTCFHRGAQRAQILLLLPLAHVLAGIMGLYYQASLLIFSPQSLENIPVDNNAHYTSMRTWVQFWVPESELGGVFTFILHPSIVEHCRTQSITAACWQQTFLQTQLDILSHRNRVKSDRTGPSMSYCGPQTSFSPHTLLPVSLRVWLITLFSSMIYISQIHSH